MKKDKEIKEETKQTGGSFMMRLIQNNTGVSSKNFFLVCTTIIGMILLGVLIGGIIVDIIFNHTITIDMTDAAAFIGAVASLFAAAGLTKAGSEWSENKFLYNRSFKANRPLTKPPKPGMQSCEDEDEDIPIPDEEEVTNEDEEVKEEADETDE